jgi:selenocysteine lyase/cysteine desulfurase
VGLSAPGGFPPDLADRFARSQVFVSIRGGSTLRVTPHVYNESWEIDRLFSCLAAA